MQATATSHLLATTVLHVTSNTDDLEFPCASPGSKEQRGKGMEVVGAMEFFSFSVGVGARAWFESDAQSITDAER
jgi:hypothetical protein